LKHDQEIISRETAEMLYKVSYHNYIPYYFWLTKIGKRELVEFIDDKLAEMTYPKIYSIFRLLIATDKSGWVSHIDQLTKDYERFPQKPYWYWKFKQLIKNSEKTPNINAALELGPNHKIYDTKIRDLLDDQEKADQLLNKACVEYAFERGDASPIRSLDLIANYKVLSKIIPDKD
jgi:hypothetical protein